MGHPEELAALRKKLDGVDQALVERLAERQEIVAAIGALKEAEGRPLRDFAREREVLQGVRVRAAGIGLDPDTAEAVLRTLIRASLERQERARVAHSSVGSGKRALVLGGAGKMGRWFADFLDAQGYGVEISDPAGPVEGYELHPGEAWETTLPKHELVVVAAPLAVSNRILHRLAELAPPGLVFDVGSLKSPLRSGLRALAEAGCRVTSVHPMFGPDTKLLSGKHVLFCDAGNPEATREARALFAPTMAELVEMSLDEHDRLVAYVLGLSHALNIAFFTALARSGEAAPALARLSSTTFDAQLEVASRVAAENPRLYFEIQSLNDHGEAALQALVEAVDAVVTRVREGDEAGFVELMEGGRRYLASRSV